jgi:uncharacterized membrane protein YedE/YeeE
LHAAADAARAPTRERARAPQPYANPYLAGVGIGVVLCAAFVLIGRGLGASGAFSIVAANGVHALAPTHGATNPFYQKYAGSPLHDWLFFEVLGILIGGFLSAYFARRLQLMVEHGPRIRSRTRLLTAFAGGSIMGVGALFARGCTSGLGLTGGALLAVGSWVFVLAAFAGAYAAAPLLRRVWR